jgi:cation diffusion facilitator family transporter
MANKKADKNHPYGHERLECVAALILAIMLFAIGIGIGWGGMKTIVAGHYEALAIPSTIALIAAIISVIIKEAMYWYTRAAAKKINSSALMADAWHHRSDAFSSIGSFLGILGARIGFPVLDAVACLIICLFIVKVSYNIFLDAINKMVDHACDDETTQRASQLILELNGVSSVDLIRTRLFGDKVYIDVEISVDGNTMLMDAHKIAHCVSRTIETNFINVKNCMVHVNPEKSTVAMDP